MIPQLPRDVYSLFRCPRTGVRMQPLKVNWDPVHGGYRVQCPLCPSTPVDGYRIADQYQWHRYDADKNAIDPLDISALLDAVIARLDDKPSFWQRALLRLRKWRLERGVPSFGRRNEP